MGTKMSERVEEVLDKEIAGISELMKKYREDIHSMNTNLGNMKILLSCLQELKKKYGTKTPK